MKPGMTWIPATISHTLSSQALGMSASSVQLWAFGYVGMTEIVTMVSDLQHLVGVGSACVGCIFLPSNHALVFQVPGGHNEPP